MRIPDETAPDSRLRALFGRITAPPPAQGHAGVPGVLGPVAVLAAAALLWIAPLRAADPLPELTKPVSDFAHVVDGASGTEIDRMIRVLRAATGDVVVVVTVPTIEPYGTIDEYAVKLFENHGRGVGDKGKNNGALILLAMKEHRVRIEVGYGLEQWITDGYAGETSRQVMAPEFAAGRYGNGLRLGAERIVGRIAQGRNVTLEGVRVPRTATRQRDSTPMPISVILIAFIIIMVISRIGGGPSGRRRFWGGPGGWSSGVGPFGGGWSGGSSGGGGGGFGGGFGGFGGGGSGGGGGGSSW